MAETKWTPGPWQFVYGDLFDHSDDGNANGFTILMAGARVKDMPKDEMPEAGAERVGPCWAIHQIRIAEDLFPEDAGHDEAEANARLISAAPDLYAALAEMCRQFTSGNPDQRDAISRAREALDKATGEP